MNFTRMWNETTIKGIESDWFNGHGDFPGGLNAPGEFNI